MSAPGPADAGRPVRRGPDIARDGRSTRRATGPPGSHERVTMSHDGNESIAIAVVEESELDDAIAQLRAHLDDPSEDPFEGPVAELRHAFGYGLQSEVSPLIEPFAALPWESLDEGATLVLSAEDVPAARAKLRKITKDPERFARHLTKASQEEVDAADVEQLDDSTEDAEATWERLAQIVRKLYRMLRKAEAAGSAVVVVLSGE